MVPRANLAVGHLEADDHRDDVDPIAANVGNAAQAARLRSGVAAARPAPAQPVPRREPRSWRRGGGARRSGRSCRGVSAAHAHSHLDLVDRDHFQRRRRRACGASRTAAWSSRTPRELSVQTVGRREGTRASTCVQGLVCHFIRSTVSSKFKFSKFPPNFFLAFFSTVATVKSEEKINKFVGNFYFHQILKFLFFFVLPYL